MVRTISSRLLVISLFGLVGCAGHPVQVGIYTPYPASEMLGEVQQKVTELGYTIQRLDTINNELIAERMIDPPIDGSNKEEITVRIGRDNTGSTRMIVTSARILPATADRPMKRVTASARTNKDANAVIQMYMKARPRKPGALN
jgi:hypothetical protein